MFRSPTPRRLSGLLIAAALAVTGAGLIAPAAQAVQTVTPAATPQLTAVTLASTIKLNNCSASLVRYPTSKDTDRAMMLTNGHCYEGGFLSAGQVIVNKSSSRTGTLLNSSGGSLATVRADEILYATMTGTDVTLYRLTSTFAQLKSSSGTTALTLSASHPVDGHAISIPSSYWKTVYSCAIHGFVSTLRESTWTWHDSIRYLYPASSCQTIGGTSGSPIIDNSTGQQVGINNTSNENGESCTLNNPCEVNADGSTTVVQGQNYGQETYWFNTCLTSTNAISLTKTGCLLTKP
jgi:hypothetical protein